MSSESPESRVELQHASNDVGSSSMRVESSSTVQFRTDANTTKQSDTRLSNSEICTSSQTGAECSVHLPNQMRIGINNLAMGSTETYETEPADVSQHENLDHVHSLDVMLHEPSRHAVKREDLSEFGQFPQIVPSRESGWDLLLQGWLVGQTQVGDPSMLPHIGGSHESLPQQIGSSTMPSNLSTDNVEVAMPPSEMPSGISIPAVLQSGLQNQFSPFRLPLAEAGNLAPSINAAPDGFDTEAIISRIQSELATSVSAAAATELPCTVNLKVWSYDLSNPCAPLQRCHLTIPHVVLCRYLLKL
jgi:activator-of-BECN1-regulated-autophagy protein 1